jgi:hypothetical protein
MYTTNFQVFYNPYKNPNNPFGDTTSVFDFISCWKAPEGNKGESYFTFFSSGESLNLSVISECFYPTLTHSHVMMPITYTYVRMYIVV